jgi:hypothetical protein
MTGVHFPGNDQGKERVMTADRRQSVAVETPPRSRTAALQEYIDRAIQELLGSFRSPEQLAPEERRGIIARYTAVLEGNFIYWMTAAYLAVASEEAHSIIEDNLREEVRDNHPGMLRKFAIAADAVPTDSDALAVHGNLQNVRWHVASLSGPKILLMMAFFEGFITRFMPYLAELAERRGSTEQEYTQVHGVVDVVHTQELFRALEAEMRLPHAPSSSAPELLEGVELLRTLIENIVHDSTGVRCSDQRSKPRTE